MDASSEHPVSNNTPAFDAASIEAAMGEGLDLADQVELDCGEFDIVIRQAAVHNEAFRASIVKHTLVAKKKSLVTKEGTTTGSYEEDVKLFFNHVMVGWGERPFTVNGAVMPWQEDLVVRMFMTKKGKVLFSKIQLAATDEKLFQIKDEDLGNS